MKHIPLLLSCNHLRENNTQEYSIYIPRRNPKFLPQISLIIADKPQNSFNLKQPVFLCEIMQLAAFLCVICAICAICGRITLKRTQSISTNETADYPADLADLPRQNPKQQNSFSLKQPVFLCEIMQLAAFVCVICVICGRIFTQEDSIYQRENKQHIICETPINNKRDVLTHIPLLLSCNPYRAAK